MKKQIILSMLTLVIFITTATAQSKGRTYTTALGVKFLDGAGITLKHFISERDALEGIGFFWNQGTRITGLYELHYDINGAPGLKMVCRACRFILGFTIPKRRWWIVGLVLMECWASIIK